MLGGLCVWFGWRLFTLRKGIECITTKLKDSEQFPDRDHLPASTQQDRLSRMTSAVFNFASEAELSKSVADGKREILEFVLDQIENGLFIVDEIQLVRYANSAARKLFPVEHDVIGMQLIEVCFDHRIVETVDLALETGVKMQDQIELPKIGKTLLVETEQLDPELKIGNGAWVMIRDVTAKLEVEQTRRDFVANASHELKTPLSIIKGYLEVMAEDSEDGMIRVMRKHTDRISRIVDDMLSISKLEDVDAGKLLNREIFDLGECVQEAIEQLHPVIEQQGATIQVKIPNKKDCQYFGDSFYFGQIFFNLIENALKQNSRPGLKILIRIKANHSIGKIVIEVIDNGIGIPSADLPEIFKRFYRVEKHHSQSDVKGTGLGLSIVKRAVEAHFGQVSVRSQPGKETKFIISLPMSQESTESAHRSKK